MGNQNRSMSEEKRAALTVDPDYERMVEPGRIAQIIWGRDYRKLVCIVNFIDRNRVLVDGGEGKLSDMKRLSMPIRWLQMTKFRIRVARAASSSEVSAMLDESGFAEACAKSSRGRRNECIRKREQLNDFGRFKLYLIKQQFRSAVKNELLRLRAAQKKMPLKRFVKQQRRDTHPVLRRVVGKFQRKLSVRLDKKMKARKKRLRRHMKIDLRKRRKSE